MPLGNAAAIDQSLCVGSEQQFGDSGRLVLSELGRNEWLIVRAKAAEFISGDRYHHPTIGRLQRSFTP